ncbi:MAG: DUF4149 domain-containing protein [Pseudomonadota bacterium]
MLPLADALALYGALFFIGLTVGAMGFFGAGVATVVFRVLGEEKAGPVIRAIFPIYYLVLAITTGLAALAGFLINVAAGLVLAVIAGGFLFARQVMMPRINALRDEIKRGSTAAKGPFDMMHAWSVRMNMLQLIVLVLVFWFLALSVS